MIDPLFNELAVDSGVPRIERLGTLTRIISMSLQTIRESARVPREAFAPERVGVCRRHERDVGAGASGRSAHSRTQLGAGIRTGPGPEVRRALRPHKASAETAASHFHVGKQFYLTYN